MSRYSDIDAILTSLGAGATVEQIEYALRDHITREVLAVLADRAAAGGGGAATASELSFVPAGTVAATDVQAAIEEVASEAGGGPITATVKDVTAAQLKALVATPITMVAAPGVGKALVPIWLFMQVAFGSVAFTDPLTSQIFIVVPGGTAAWSFDSSSAFIPSPGPTVFTQAADAYWWGQPNGQGASIAPPLENTRLELANYGGDLAAGDGSARFVVYTTTVDLV